MQFSIPLRNNRLSQISTLVGVGGVLKFYTGSPPGVGNPPTGTLLSTLTAVVFSAPSGGTMTITTAPDPKAAAGGTPGYFRIVSSSGTAVVEGTAGIGSGELSFSSAITADGNVSLTSGTFTEGNSQVSSFDVEITGTVEVQHSLAS